MLNELKFVQGSVSSKDILPALTHFVIEDGTVRGYNGVIALCSPIPFDLSCKPKAIPLVKAIGNCNETIQLSLTATGRLSIHSGKFKAFIDCIEGETPHVTADGQPFEINGVELLAAFKRLFPFIGTDASRPWCEGVLLDGQSAFSTNNIILAEYWVGSAVPFPVNIPKVAIKEMIRIGEPPETALIQDNSISFLYSKGRWIRSQLLATDWPDVRAILDRPANFIKVDQDIFEGLEVIKPFADKLNRVIFNCNIMSTHLDVAEGASYDLQTNVGESIYTIEMLQLLKGVAQSIDWSQYPKPCPWVGDRIRGVVIGLRS